MEDEDGEGSNVDSWTLPEQLMYKDSSYVCDTLNKRTNNVSDYVDGVEENKEDATTDDKLFNSKIIFKGFKKRILAQTQENQLPDRILINNQDGCITSPSKSSKDKSNDCKRGKITEYAQYLGLQPTGKYKCPKCNPIVTFRTMSMLKQHQCVCTSITNVSHGLPSTSEQHSINTATSASNNFRISRKVYLCAACGTYFENWNLFLHMREIHKRHICLFCLGMFGQAERLSHHLVKKHSVPETQFHTIDEFYSVFKGSCYLICCTCEKVFSETDNFYFHTCVTLNERTFTNSICSICRQTDGTHSSKCGVKKPECNFERKNINERIQASDSEQTLFPNPANAVAKKLLCANKARLKTSERFLLSSYKRKLLDMYARKLKRQKYNSKNFERDCDARGLSRVDALVDVKSALAPAAALHTTKYESDREHNRQLTSNNAIKDRHIVEIDVTKSPAHERIIDRYTDTIMQVSQCSDELDSSNELKYDEGFEIDHGEGQLTGLDELSMERDDDDDEDYDRINNLDDTSENIEQGELILDDGNDDTPVDSPSVTPNHSNFISIQESIMKTQEKLISPSILDEDTSCMISKESPRVTVSRVNSTKRSLVIKICTNKNSQFTVATPNGNGNYESNSHGDNDDDDNEDEDDDEEDEDGESEGNNNVGDAGSEKEISATDSESGNLSVALPEVSTDKNEIESMTLATTTLSPITAAITTTTTTTAAEVATAPPTTTAVTSIAATINAIESAAVELSNESPAIAVEEKKIEETSQTKETTIIDTHSTSSEPLQLNKDSETSNVDVNQSNESMVDNSLIIATDNPETITPDEQQQMSTEQMSDGITLAAEEIPSIDLNVSGTLDSIEIEDLLKCCIEAASPTCIYCNHARHIAVNGKQLGLHILAEHRFQPQHPAIIIQRDQFNVRVKKSLDELTTRWFNLDSYDNTRGTYNVSTVKTYECYLCRIYYSVHKELYLHNRKMHQKTILICIMCKSTFYSHSELLCHLCPGVYSSHINIKYRCCLCSIESLPSAFRLMVHLRKRHHACDVCLESTGNQQRLSNHVWKHKLHHLCYRCGIAYRNKPDITKHLFWKHGTESVLCKKCLQKKWPHIYHFCIPPSVFVCEECGSTFSRAVALKVHKRLHSGDNPYSCLECSASFISKKLLIKHNEIHKPVQLENPIVQVHSDSEQIQNTTTLEINKITNHDEQMEVVSDTSNIAPSVQKEIVKKVMDVYDLPPLNLSSDSDSDTEDDKTLKKEENIDSKHENLDDVCKNVDVVTINNEENENIVSTLCKNVDINVENITDHILSTETNDSIRDVDESNEEETKKEEVVIMNGIWDNFKSYTASLESSEINIKADNDNSKNDELLSVITAEHDYCIVYGDNSKEEENTVTDNIETENDGSKNVTSPSTPSITANGENDTAKRKTNKSPKKKGNKSLDDGGGGGSSTSSDSSSDSDSSSCSCGTNCSCSSSSSGSSTSSSSSSDSDCSTSESSPKKSTANKKDRRKEKDMKKNHAKDSTEVTRADAEIEVQAENGVQSVDDSAAVEPTVNVTEQEVNDKVILPPPPAPLRESDLETDETETDEDFYDEYPQQHANKLLAEKRNQLMLLATVAPPSADDSALGSSSNDMKNGIIDASNDIGNSSPPSQLQVAQIKTNVKRKIKTKRRKKGEGGRGRGRQSNSVQSTATAVVNPSPIVESIKLNIPKILYRNKQPGARRRSSSPNVNTLKSREPKLPAVTYQISQSDYNTNQLTPSRTINAHNSSNENESANENKRSSKRKRVPKRFYGDSSDEEQQRLPNSITQKWRRLDSHTPVNSYVPSITIKQNYGPPSATIQSTKNYQAVPSVSIVPEIQTEQETTPAIITTPVSISEPAPVSSVTESEDQPDGSSSDSSTSDNEQSRHPPPRQHPGENNLQGTTVPNRQANLYCYCQCPYDEVSEMIACDGNNCRIEWFHFECVGIMVPPKGKWYCPDCSKRDPTLPNNEYLV